MGGQNEGYLYAIGSPYAAFWHLVFANTLPTAVSAYHGKVEGSITATLSVELAHGGMTLYTVLLGGGGEEHQRRSFLAEPSCRPYSVSCTLNPIEISNKCPTSTILADSQGQAQASVGPMRRIEDECRAILRILRSFSIPQMSLHHPCKSSPSCMDRVTVTD